MKLLELLDTDPLAKMALLGFVCVIVVSLAVFGFVMTRGQAKSRRDKPLK